MRKGLLIAAGLAVSALGVAAYLLAGPLVAKRPIVVGLLYSESGPLAAGERTMKEAVVLALEELNAGGGVLGRPVVGVVADGRSQPSAFAQQAHRLIAVDRASVIFAGPAPPCRKAVRPIVEEAGHLLFNASVSEGGEQSPNIVSTGGTANQQVLPAVGWCLETLKARTFFLVGSDSVGPHVLAALVNDQLKALGGKVVGEAYVPPEGNDLSGVVARIKQAAPDVVVSSLEGASNPAFYEGMARAGVTPDRTPIVSFAIDEEALRTLPIKAVAGHYAARNYLQAIERPENAEFVRKFKARYGADRVTNDGASTAYNSVLLWAQAVAEAGSAAPAAVRRVIRRQSLDAAEGVVSVDDGNLYNWRPFYLGKVRPDGQLDIVFAVSKPIQPLPYPWTRSRAEWDALLAELSAGWGGQWAGSASR